MKTFRDDCQDRLVMLFHDLNAPTSTLKTMFKAISHTHCLNFTVKGILFYKYQYHGVWVLLRARRLSKTKGTFTHPKTEKKKKKKVKIYS